MKYRRRGTIEASPVYFKDCKKEEIMTEVALRNEAVTLLNELSEQKLLSAILYMRFIKQQNMEESASAKKHKVLEALAGSIHDDTFIRPEQPSLEQRNWL